MKISTIIETLSSPSESELPTAALQAAIEQWSELYPHITQAMDKFIAQPESLTEQENSLLFFGILLMGEAKHTDGLEKLLLLCSREDGWESDLECVIGDTITELMPTIYYHLAAGNYQSLNQFILGSHPSEYCRAAAIEVIFMQYSEGKLTEAKFKELFAEWLQHFLNQDDDLGDFILAIMCNLCLAGGIKEYQETFLELAKQKKLDEDLITMEDIMAWDDLSSSPDSPTYQIQKDFSVSEELSNWHGFSLDELISDLDPEEFGEFIPHDLDDISKTLSGSLVPLDPEFISEQPRISPPKVGRNDPCPCGSGKKYKKCCLH